MRKQDQLLELIASLTASEKRYFKVFCKTQTSSKNYVALFDELENSKIYDAKLLAKKLNVSTATLANDKDYLQEVLLRSLRLYHENNSIESTLLVEYMEASLLYKKGLVSYCLNQCNKMMAKAMKYERFTMALSIGRLQAVCYAHLRQFDELKNADIRETELLGITSEYSRMIHLRDTLLEPMLTRKALADVEDLSNNTFFNTPSEQLQSFHARLCQGEIGMFYYQYIKPDAQKTLNYAVLQLEEFKKHPHFIPINNSAYYTLLSKLSVRYYGAGNFDQALYYIEMLIDETEGKSELSKFNNNGNCVKLTLLTLKHKFSESTAFAQRHYSIKDSLAPNERLTFLMDYALSSFYTGNYDACHQQLSLIIDDNTEDRLDLQLQARLLFLILQLQLKNYSLIAYQSKSLKGWIQKTKTVVSGAAELITWLEKLAKAEAKFKVAETFLLFKTALQQEPLKNLADTLFLQKWELTDKA